MSTGSTRKMSRLYPDLMLARSTQTEIRVGSVHSLNSQSPVRSSDGYQQRIRDTVRKEVEHRRVRSLHLQPRLPKAGQQTKTVRAEKRERGTFGRKASMLR